MRLSGKAQTHGDIYPPIPGASALVIPGASALVASPR